MAEAQIIKVWRDKSRAFVAVRVDEGNGIGQVEYMASVEINDEFNALSNAQKKEALRAAVKAERDARLSDTANIGGITGIVTI